MTEPVNEQMPPPEEVVSFGYRRVSAADKPNLVQQHFTTVAARYDLVNTILSFGLHHVWKRLAVRLMGLRPGHRVLDVCAGTGDLALLAAPRVGPAGRVVLYDFNQAMLELGAAKVDKAGLRGRLVAVRGDAERLAFPDGSFDAAMVGFGIRNLTHWERGFAEMHRVLKPGGALMCLEFSRPASAWFRALYNAYSFSLMPLVGKIFVNSWQAYRYLPESIRLFPAPEELSAVLTGLGFAGVFYRRLTNGIAVIHVGRKL